LPSDTTLTLCPIPVTIIMSAVRIKTCNDWMDYTYHLLCLLCYYP